MGKFWVMVDLFSRETIMLEFLPNRKMERVCQTIMKRIIFTRGVPDELRSDNAPEFMQGIVRQVCQYLDIAQINCNGRAQSARQSHLRKSQPDSWCNDQETFGSGL
jgi:hypothetical protein